MKEDEKHGIIKYFSNLALKEMKPETLLAIVATGGLIFISYCLIELVKAIILK